MEKTLFQKIVDGELKTDILYQDDMVTAFKDIDPNPSIHILIVPNITIPTLNDISSENELMLGRMVLVASKLAKKYSIDKSGYRLSMNCNEDAGQSIFHIHMHLLGGENLGGMYSK